MVDKNTFLLYKDSYEEVMLLSIEQRGKLLTALYEYAITTQEPDFDDIALKIVFSTIKRGIDRDSEKYEERCKRNKELGKLGGRPKKLSDSYKSERLSEKPNETERFSTKAKKADTDNDTDNDSENISADAPPAPPAGKKKSSRFIPPTVDDVKAYCSESGKYIDVERFIDFYTSKGWLVGKSPMRDWRAAVRNWYKRDSSAGVQGTNTDYPHDLDDLF